MTTETAAPNQADANTAFLRAARAGQLDKVLALLNQDVDINVCNANGLNAIHLASKDGHVEVVKELLSRGALIDSATKKGNTALHIASLAGQEDVVKLLVQTGAQVNIQSQNGFTPLYMAAQENHDSVVKFLLSNGANQTLSTEDGFTPLAVAMQQGHEKVVALLLEADSRGKVRLPALHIAAKKDDVKAANLLLENEHNPDVTSKSGFTPLHIAAHYGNEAVAKLLLAKGANVNCPAKHNICPLHVAAKWGKENMVTILCDNGANVEARTRDGLTPLHCAARSGHDRVVELLLDRGAPISSKSKNGLAALHMAAQGDHADAARSLLARKAPVDDVTVDYLTALHVAAHCGHARAAKLLLDRNADANARALNGFTPLHIACKKNRIKVVELLLKYGASISATTESGLTPLHVASFMGAMNIVIYLLQHGASPDVPTVRGETALHLAARANQTDIIRILLRNGACVDAAARERQTPLHIASRLGNSDIVVLLLQHGADINAATAEHYNALHIAAKQNNHDVVAALIEHGAPITSTTKKGFTPLHLAAKYGNLKVAQLLLSHGASPDMAGKNGVTPLHVAAQYDQQPVVHTLLEKGANAKAVAKNGHTPLHIAARKNQMEAAATLLEYGADVNAESKSGYTPLHLAGQLGNTDMCSLLIENGANVDAQAEAGLATLHLAAQGDHVPVAKLLVNGGANVNLETKGGYTPMHIACHYGQANMVRYLLESGADVNAKTSHGYTPLHHAAQQGHINIVNILLEHKADPNDVTNAGQTPFDIASQLGYVTIMETLKEVTDPNKAIAEININEKYKVVAPEPMRETFISDSEEEGGDELMVAEHSYKYLTLDEMKSFGDASLHIDVTRDERAESRHSQNIMEMSQTSMTGLTNGGIDYSCHEDDAMVKSISKYSAQPGDGYCYNVDPNVPNFLVSFVADAQGCAVRGTRGGGVRVLVPPNSAQQPTRITCRYLKASRINHMPPLMEGEALASRVIEMGPVAAKFLGPIIIEVPHFASLRNKEREIVVLRSDNGTSWREHTVEASDQVLQDILQDSLEIEETDEQTNEKFNRVSRILTHDFPQYFAVISRIKQEVHAIGPEGGMVSSTVVPQVQAVFPQGALTKKIKVGLQAQIINSELTAKLLGRGVAVSPVVTVEPRRRKFHKAITLSMPAPRPHTQGMTNQYTSSAPTLRLLCSISGGTNRAHWEDVTDNTPLTFVNDCVSFTTTVSARYWLIDCRNVGDATKMATELYKEAIHVPFMAKFIVYAKRIEQDQALVRMFCVTDDKEEKTLERMQKFTQVVKSRDVEVLEGKPTYFEFAGNLTPISKSDEQLTVPFRAFRENRAAFPVMLRSSHTAPTAKCVLMHEPKLPKGEVQPQPICVLNITVPDEIIEEVVQMSTPTMDLEVSKELSDRRNSVWKQRLTDPSFTEICSLLGRDWVPLAYELGVDVSTVNQIQAKRLTINEQAELMLKLWKTQSGTKARDNSLELALMRIGRDDIIMPQSDQQTESRIQRNLYQQRQASEEIDSSRVTDQKYQELVVEKTMDLEQHDQSESKYSPEEKSIESDRERTPSPSDESEEDDGVKHSVAERKEQITRKLSSSKIPASKQKKEIREEIIEIKTQIKPDVKKFKGIEEKVQITETSTKQTRKSSIKAAETVQVTIQEELEIRKTTEISPPAKPTPKHLQKHTRNESMHRFSSGDYSDVVITPKKSITEVDKNVITSMTAGVEDTLDAKASEVFIESETSTKISKEVIKDTRIEKIELKKSPDLSKGSKKGNVLDSKKSLTETTVRVSTEKSVDTSLDTAKKIPKENIKLQKTPSTEKNQDARQRLSSGSSKDDVKIFKTPSSEKLQEIKKNSTDKSPDAPKKNIKVQSKEDVKVAKTSSSEKIQGPKKGIVDKSPDATKKITKIPGVEKKRLSSTSSKDEIILSKTPSSEKMQDTKKKLSSDSSIGDLKEAVKSEKVQDIKKKASSPKVESKIRKSPSSESSGKLSKTSSKEEVRLAKTPISERATTAKKKIVSPKDDSRSITKIPSAGKIQDPKRKSIPSSPKEEIRTLAKKSSSDKIVKKLSSDSSKDDVKSLIKTSSSETLKTKKSSSELSRQSISESSDKSPDLVEDISEVSLKEKISSFESKITQKESKIPVRLTKEALKQHTQSHEKSIEYTQEFVMEQNVHDTIKKFDRKIGVDKKSTDSETETESQLTVKVEKGKKQKDVLAVDPKVFVKTESMESQSKLESQLSATSTDASKSHTKTDSSGSDLIAKKLGLDQELVDPLQSTERDVSFMSSQTESKVSGSRQTRSDSLEEAPDLEEQVISVASPTQRPTDWTHDEIKSRTADFLVHETEFYGTGSQEEKLQQKESPGISAKARQFIETVPDEDSVQDCFFSKRIYSDSLEDSEQSESRRHSEAESLKSDQSEPKMRIQSDFDERAEIEEEGPDSGSGFGDENLEEAVCGFTSMKDIITSTKNLDEPEDGACIFEKVKLKKTDSKPSTVQEFQMIITEAEDVPGSFDDKDDLSDKISSESSREIEISDRKSSDDKISSEDAVTEKKSTSEEEEARKQGEEKQILNTAKTVTSEIEKIETKIQTLRDEFGQEKGFDNSKRPSVISGSSLLEFASDDKRPSDVSLTTESRDYTMEESDSYPRQTQTHTKVQQLHKLVHGDSLDDVEAFPEDHVSEHVHKLPQIEEFEQHLQQEREKQLEQHGIVTKDVKALKTKQESIMSDATISTSISFDTPDVQTPKVKDMTNILEAKIDEERRSEISSIKKTVQELSQQQLKAEVATLDQQDDTNTAVTMSTNVATEKIEDGILPGHVSETNFKTDTNILLTKSDTVESSGHTVYTTKETTTTYIFGKAGSENPFEKTQTIDTTKDYEPKASDDKIEILIKQATEESDDQRLPVEDDTVTPVEKYFEPPQDDFDYDETPHRVLSKSLSRDSGEVVLAPRKKTARTFSVQSSPEEVEEHILTESESDMDKAKVLEIVEPSEDTDFKVSTSIFDTRKLKTDSLDDADDLFPEKDMDFPQLDHETPIHFDHLAESQPSSSDFHSITKKPNILEKLTASEITSKSTTGSSATTVISTLTKSTEDEPKSILEDTTAADISRESDLIKDSDLFKDAADSPKLFEDDLKKDLSRDYSKTSVDSKDTSRDFATSELSMTYAHDLQKDSSRTSMESKVLEDKSIADSLTGDISIDLGVSKASLGDTYTVERMDSNISVDSKGADEKKEESISIIADHGSEIIHPDRKEIISDQMTDSKQLKTKTILTDTLTQVQGSEMQHFLEGNERPEHDATGASRDGADQMTIRSESEHDISTNALIKEKNKAVPKTIVKTGSETMNYTEYEISQTTDAAETIKESSIAVKITKEAFDSSITVIDSTAKLADEAFKINLDQSTKIIDDKNISKTLKTVIKDEIKEATKVVDDKTTEIGTKLKEPYDKVATGTQKSEMETNKVIESSPKLLDDEMKTLDNENKEVVCTTTKVVDGTVKHLETSKSSVEGTFKTLEHETKDVSVKATAAASDSILDVCDREIKQPAEVVIKSEKIETTDVDKRIKEGIEESIKTKHDTIEKMNNEATINDKKTNLSDDIVKESVEKISIISETTKQKLPPESPDRPKEEIVEEMRDLNRMDRRYSDLLEGTQGALIRIDSSHIGHQDMSLKFSTTPPPSPVDLQFVRNQHKDPASSKCTESKAKDSSSSHVSAHPTVTESQKTSSESGTSETETQQSELLSEASRRLSEAATPRSPVKHLAENMSFVNVSQPTLTGAKELVDQTIEKSIDVIGQIKYEEAEIERENQSNIETQRYPSQISEKSLKFENLDPQQVMTSIIRNIAPPAGDFTTVISHTQTETRETGGREIFKETRHVSSSDDDSLIVKTETLHEISGHEKELKEKTSTIKDGGQTKTTQKKSEKLELGVARRMDIETKIVHSIDDADAVLVQREHLEQGLYSGRQSRSEEKMTAIKDDTVDKTNKVTYSERDISHDQWGREYFVEPSELEAIHEDADITTPKSFVESTVKTSEKDEQISSRESIKEGITVSVETKYSKEESVVETKEHDDLSSQDTSFKNESKHDESEKEKSTSSPKSKSFKKENETYKIDFIKEIKVESSNGKSQKPTSRTESPHSDLDIDIQLPHDDIPLTSDEPEITVVPQKVPLELEKKEMSVTSSEAEQKFEVVTNLDKIQTLMCQSSDSDTVTADQTLKEPAIEMSKSFKTDILSPSLCEPSSLDLDTSKDLMIKSGGSMDTECMTKSLESHEGEALQKSIDSTSAEILQQSDFSAEADSALNTGTDTRKDEHSKLVKEKSLEDICSSGYDTDLSSAEFHAEKLELERLGEDFKRTSKDQSVFGKLIDKQMPETGIVCAKVELKTSAAAEPEAFGKPEPTKPILMTKREESVLSESFSQHSQDESIISVIQKEIVDKERSPIPDSVEYSGSGPHSILETESDIITSDRDDSSNSPEVKLRVGGKKLKTKIHGGADRRSTSDVEGYSSSESHFQSFEKSDSPHSRPLSSDIENLTLGPSTGEFTTALTSTMSSKSQKTSKEYYTAVSSMTSRDSMKSLDSESSGHLASIDISDASETLVPSASELKEELFESGNFTDQESDLLKDVQEKHSLVRDLTSDEEEDHFVVHEPVGVMKRSHEMRFQPKEIVPEHFPLESVSESLDLDEETCISKTSAEWQHNTTVVVAESITTSDTLKSREDDPIVEVIEKSSVTDVHVVPFKIAERSEKKREFVDLESQIIANNSEEYKIITGKSEAKQSGYEKSTRSSAAHLESKKGVSEELEVVEEKCVKATFKEVAIAPLPSTPKLDSKSQFGDEEGKITEKYTEEKSETFSSAQSKDEIIVKTSTVNLKIEKEVYENLGETKEHCAKTTLKEIEAMPFPITSKPVSQRQFTDLEGQIISKDSEEYEQVTEISKSSSDVKVSYPLDSKQSSASSVKSSAPSQGSDSTDVGKEYVLQDIYDIAESSETIGDSKSELLITTEERSQIEKGQDSPISDEFEMVDKPSEEDDFVIIEEVAKEAGENDGHGKILTIKKSTYVKKHDEEVEEYLSKLNKSESELSSSASTDDDDQRRLQEAELADIEAGRKWIQMQFEGDPRYEYEVRPLEDIKEEEMTDFDASRMGSLSSQKESIGSLGSMRNSYGSLSESEGAVRRRFMVKGDQDDVSISSLQEFENLEKALMEQYQQTSSSSQDSLNGSLPKRYLLSRSLQGDDISISSLKEFEGLETACLESMKLETEVKKKEELLATDSKIVTSGFLEHEKRSYSGSSEGSPPQKADSKSDSPSLKSGSPGQKGSPSSKVLGDSAAIRKLIDDQLEQQKGKKEPVIVTVKRFDSRGSFFAPEQTGECVEGEVQEECSKVTTYVCASKKLVESLPGDRDEITKVLEKEAQKKTQEQIGAINIPHTNEFDSLEPDISTSITSTQSDMDSMATVIDKPADRLSMNLEKSLDLDLGLRELSPMSGRSMGKHFTDPASVSWSGQDEDISSSGSLGRARADLMLGSTDSLEGTSSNATRATYNYEVDTPMTGSLTSGGSHTMVSSLDALDPITAFHIEAHSMNEPTYFESHDIGSEQDPSAKTPRAKERTIMFDSTDTLSAVSGDSVKEIGDAGTAHGSTTTFFIGDTPIVRGERKESEPALSESCPASLPREMTSPPASPPVPAQRSCFCLSHPTGKSISMTSLSKSQEQTEDEKK